MKPSLWIVPSALVLIAACGSEAAESDSQGPAPAPGESAEPVAQEPLPTAEEAAAAAEQAIDASNAEAELQRLQEELGGG